MALIKTSLFYLKKKKKFWLTPAIIVLLFIGFVIFVGGEAAFAPMISIF